MDKNVGVYVECLCGKLMDTFDLYRVKVIVGSLGALFTQSGHNSKMPSHRKKGTKIWASVVYMAV